MTKLIAIASCTLLSIAVFLSCTDKQSNPSLKSVAVEQFRNANSKQGWFVPLTDAIQGMTAQDAIAADSGSQSVGELVTHLLFWNKRLLIKFQADSIVPAPSFTTDIRSSFFVKDWDKTVNELDSVLYTFESAIAASDDRKIEIWFETLSNMNLHNAYHTGQIVYIRRKQGNWSQGE